MKYLFILALLMLTSVAYSQSGLAAPIFEKGLVRGTIVDSADGTPLQFATITMHRQADKAFTGGASTGTNGEFILTKITEGKYFLKVTYVGYETKYVSNLDISSAKSEYTIGAVRMTKNALQLKAAEVVGERMSEELHLDKKVINVSQNSNAAGGTALDVLQDQPSIRVDPDGTVYLRGSSNFTILINGKPSVLQGSDALKQISASTIENIEIMTNPSAKYDAEGSAGIVNINLKKQSEYTFSGIANMNAGTKDKYNADASFSSNKNGMNFTGGFDYRDNMYLNDQRIDGNSLYSSGSTNNLTNLNIRDKRKQYTIRAGMDYIANESNTLSLSLSTGKIGIDRTMTTHVDNTSPMETKYAESRSVLDIPIKFFNSTMNYVHKITPKDDELSVEATFSRVTIPNDLTTNEFVTDPTHSIRIGQPKITVFSNDAARNEGRAKINYSHKFNPQSTLELGAQSNFNYRNFNVVNKIYDWTSSDYTTDPGLTNDFKFRNNVHAGFVTYSNEYQGFSFLAGVRGEYMDRLLQQQTIGGDYGYTKLDFFPSFSVSKKIDDHQLQLSYSRRVNRPNENLLNPFPFYKDTYLSSSGNPRLLPEYINSFELNYQKTFGTVFVSAQTYYRNSTNGMLQTFTTDSTGKMATTFGNFATTNTYGSELSGSFTIAQIIRLDPSVNLFGTDLAGDLDGQSISKKAFNWTARLNTTVTFSKDTRLQVSGNYFGKSMDAQSEVEPFFMLTASLKQDFFEKALSLTLQARNILTTSDINLTSTGPNYNSTIHVRNEVPVVSLIMSYNFNNFKRSARPNDNIDVQPGL